MSDQTDLRELQEEKRVRVSAMAGGIVAAAVAICFAVLTAMWYDGWFTAEFGQATAPSNPAANVSEAPATPTGTVGQAPQKPAPAQDSE